MVLAAGAILGMASVTIRDVGRRDLFDDDTDRERFLEQFQDAVATDRMM